MSTERSSFFRAFPLLLVAVGLSACPAVTPETTPAVTPRSGLWGLTVVDVGGDPMCASVAEMLEGRVVRMDLYANARGELELQVGGLSLFGAHEDGAVWADAAVRVPWGAWPSVAVAESGEWTEGEDLPADDDGWTDGDEGSSEPGAGWGGGRGLGRLGGLGCVDVPDSEWDEGGDCGVSDPWMSEVGISVSLDGEIRHREAISGTLVVTLEAGGASCTVDADVAASFLSELPEDDGDYDVPSEPPRGEPEPVPYEAEPGGDGDE